MKDYGDRVQFSLCSGPLPSYQLINSFDKKMAFDRNHHLLRTQEEEFSAANATAVFSMDEIDAMARGVRRVEERKTKSVRVVRTTNAGTRITVGKLEDQFAAERYEYFRANRATLPPTITEHTEEIAALMKQGKSAEEAFGAIIQQHYKT